MTVQQNYTFPASNPHILPLLCNIVSSITSLKMAVNGYMLITIVWDSRLCYTRLEQGKKVSDIGILFFFLTDTSARNLQ